MPDPFNATLDQINHTGSAWEAAVSYSWTQQNIATASLALSPFAGAANMARAINSGWIKFEDVENRLRADGYIEFGIMSDPDASILKREIIAAAKDPSLNDGYVDVFPKQARNAIQKALVNLISKARLDKNFKASKDMAGGG